LTHWQPRPAGDLPDGLILFDGVCVMCSGVVNFVLRRDAARHFRFLAIQSEAGKVLAHRFGIDLLNPETFAVVRNGELLFKSEAALAIAQKLPGWRWTWPVRALPRGLRDFIYDRVARSRYRLFGKRETCLMPTSDIKARFIATIADLAKAP
jgi:predicted DCC family thiol-disulfide oxidoreductase YuxK